ncbi:MAG: M20/M25/M40 family metallo-hydrolase [Desulfurococcaceae archaeon]
MGTDIRDFNEGNISKFKGDIEDFLDQLTLKYGVRVSTQTLLTHKPVPLSNEVISVIENTAKQMGIKTKRVNSGAGHDSQNLASKVKTGMIFVPSYRGISHSPLEWTDWNDVITGVRVLKETIKALASSPPSECRSASSH